MNRRQWLGPTVLVASLVVIVGGLATWKSFSIVQASTAAANQPEPMESVTVATAKEREHRPTTTSIGTVVALRSITLRNELPGTVRQVRLVPGQIVEAGTVLVQLDVSVEEAELQALKAQATLAETQLNRVQRMVKSRAVSEMELDNAIAERDVALAQIARTKAIIERKTIRAPFRARVGIADVHPGQYLNEGTLLTTLQGVDDSAYVDFAVAQQVAAVLKPGTQVDVFGRDSKPVNAEIVAIDARVDPATRNAMVRARIPNAATAPAPGTSVRVVIPVAEARKAVTVPVSALRKGPSGDHVFVVEAGSDGRMRAYMRQVTAGTVLGDEVVIERGLSAGEQVAASGSFKLREAALVAVANAASTTQTAEAQSDG